MLSFFRNGGIGNVVVAGIAFLIIVAFAVEFRTGSGRNSGKLALECVVSYDGECVDPKDFFAAQGVIVPRGIESKVAKRYAFNKKVLDGLVERELLVAEAKKLGLRISQETLDKELMSGRVRASLPADVINQYSAMLGLCPGSRGYCAPGSEFPVKQLQGSDSDGFDYKAYERQVRLLTNRGPKEFKEMQERELLAARMRDIIRSRVRIPDSEARALFERERTKVVVRSVSLKRDWFAKYAIALDEAAVDKWSLANQTQVDGEWTNKKADFTDGCQTVSEVFVALPPGALDDEKQPVRLKAQQARERVVKGESFDSVAREVSDGDTAMLGGELGCIGAGYGIGNEELKKAVDSLKVGDVSEVIETPRGYHVLKVAGKLSADKLEREGRRFTARKLYTRFAADEALAKFAEQLILRAKAGEKLDEVTRALSVDFSAAHAGKEAKKNDSADSPALLAVDRPHFEISAPFTMSGNPVPDVEPSEPLAPKAFELKQPDELYSRPVPTTTGALVMQLKERTDPSQEDFIKEKGKAVEALLEIKSSEALVRYVADLRRAAGDKLKVLSQYGEESKARAEDE
jgi:peptidyl-prolyl cis-trans isomerase D